MKKILTFLIGLLLPISALAANAPDPIPQIPTIAALKLYSAGLPPLTDGVSMVQLTGYYAAGDLGARAPTYLYSSTACSLGTGNGDGVAGGSQVKAVTNGCWNVAQWGGGYQSVKNWGAICNGSPHSAPDSDYVAMQAMATYGTTTPLNVLEPTILEHCMVKNVVNFGNIGTSAFRGHIEGAGSQLTTWEFTNDGTTFASWSWANAAAVTTGGSGNGGIGMYFHPTNSGSPEQTGAQNVALSNMTIKAASYGVGLLVSQSGHVNIGPDVAFSSRGSVAGGNQAAALMAWDQSLNVRCDRCSFGEAYFAEAWIAHTNLYPESAFYNDAESITNSAFNGSAYAAIMDSGGTSFTVHEFNSNTFTSQKCFAYIGFNKGQMLDMHSNWAEDTEQFIYSPPQTTQPSVNCPSGITNIPSSVAGSLLFPGSGSGFAATVYNNQVSSEISFADLSGGNYLSVYNNFAQNNSDLVLGIRAPGTVRYGEVIQPPALLDPANGSYVAVDGLTPTLGSGWGAGAAVGSGVVAPPWSFVVAVGTSAGNTGGLGMPNTSTNYNCFATNATHPNFTARVVPVDATHVNVESYNASGTLAAPAASDLIYIGCQPG